MMKMKQGRSAAMWVVMMMIMVQTHVSIAAQDEEKSVNGSNNNNNSYGIGMIENEFEFDEEFPDAISSHFHGRVVQQTLKLGSVVMPTSNKNNAAISAGLANSYRGSSPLNPNSFGDDKCKIDSKAFKRKC